MKETCKEDAFMRRMLSILLILALTGVPQMPETETVTLEEVITSIQTEEADQAAEVLLDWTEQGGTATEEEVLAILDANGLPPEETAWAFAAVLDAADNLGVEMDAGFSPLFTQVLTLESTPYREEPTKALTDLSQLYGMWYDSEMQELLIVSETGCRVVIPWLGYCGEVPYAVRLRDRSASGYVPALEVDFHGSGDFSGALTYYVSGADDTHFWSNTQGQRFDKLH